MRLQPRGLRIASQREHARALDFSARISTAPRFPPASFSNTTAIRQRISRAARYVSKKIATRSRLANLPIPILLVSDPKS